VELRHIKAALGLLLEGEQLRTYITEQIQMRWGNARPVIFGNSHGYPTIIGYVLCNEPPTQTYSEQQAGAGSPRMEDRVVAELRERLADANIAIRAANSALGQANTALASTEAGLQFIAQEQRREIAEIGQALLNANAALAAAQTEARQATQAYITLEARATHETQSLQSRLQQAAVNHENEVGKLQQTHAEQLQTIHSKERQKCEDLAQGHEDEIRKLNDAHSHELRTLYARDQEGTQKHVKEIEALAEEIGALKIQIDFLGTRPETSDAGIQQHDEGPIDIAQALKKADLSEIYRELAKRHGKLDGVITHARLEIDQRCFVCTSTLDQVHFESSAHQKRVSEAKPSAVRQLVLDMAQVLAFASGTAPAPGASPNVHR
jgi:hypothetical protein